MFTLKKIISAFLMPPGIFVFLLFAASLQKKRRALVVFLVGLMIYCFSILPVTALLASYVEAPNWNEDDLKSADSIVMLGGGISDGVKDLSGVSIPGWGSSIRVLDTARLYLKYHLPVIVSGGSVFGLGDEATVYARFLGDLGVPSDKIITENNSRDTKESAEFVKKIVEEKGFKKSILVTSSFHMRRSLFLFNALNTSVTPFPSGAFVEPPHYTWNDYLPNASNLSYSALALKEVCGLVVYKVGAYVKTVL